MSWECRREKSTARTMNSSIAMRKGMNGEPSECVSSIFMWPWDLAVRGYDPCCTYKSQLGINAFVLKREDLQSDLHCISSEYWLDNVGLCNKGGPRRHTNSLVLHKRLFITCFK